MGRTITDWLAFFDSRHFLYVNARHKDVHYRLIAKEIAALVPAPDARVLDYGCGEALHAELSPKPPASLSFAKRRPASARHWKSGSHHTPISACSRPMRLPG